MPDIFDCEQGTEEWFQCRLGIPTASMFATVMASGRGGGESKTRKTYLHKLAGEIITGEPAESYSNQHMERGHEHEPTARATYAFLNDCDPQTVGFIRNGLAGGSPDALVGDDGILELKSKLPHLHIEAMLRGSFPPDHLAQCQGLLWVAEREWCDLSIYWPSLPLVTYRTTRDEAYIQRLSDAVDAFTEELDLIVGHVRSYGVGDALRRSLKQSVDAA